MHNQISALYINRSVLMLKLLINLFMSIQILKQPQRKVPHFQKDVINPVIYDLDNMKLIQSCAYPQSPKNKVHEIKKKNIQKVIKAILNKVTVSTHSTPQTNYFNSSQKIDNKISNHSQYALSSQQPQQSPYQIEIDEQLGQLACNMQEDFLPFSDRVKKVLLKAKHQSKPSQQTQQVQTFVNLICNQSKLSMPDPRQFKKVTGLIEDLDRISKQKTLSDYRKRAQSAKLLKNNSQTSCPPPSRLSQSRSMTQSNLHTKIKARLKGQLSKSQRLFEKIHAYYDVIPQDKKTCESSLSKMRSEWSEKGHLQRVIRSKLAELSPATLNILRDRRLRQSAVGLLDCQLLKL